MGQAAGSAAALTVRVFHYTTPDCLLSIIAYGLRVATAGVSGPERPAVWCTTSENYEPTALKGTLTKQGEAKLARAKRRKQGRVAFGPGDAHTFTLEEQTRVLGLARVEVRPDAAPLTWAAWTERSGVTPETAEGLRAVAASDVNEWRASLEPIPPEGIVGMDVWHEGEWLPVARRTTAGSFEYAVGPGSPFPRPKR